MSNHMSSTGAKRPVVRIRATKRFSVLEISETSKGCGPSSASTASTASPKKRNFGNTDIASCTGTGTGTDGAKNSKSKWLSTQLVRASLKY